MSTTSNTKASVDAPSLNNDSTEFSNDEDSQQQRSFKDFQVVVNSKNQVVIKNFGQQRGSAAGSVAGSTTSSSNKVVENGGGGTSTDGGGRGGGGGGGQTTPKKFNHENFSKSIYIGTKNAERWDMLRTQMKYKNDVEFVTFLLNLVEKYVTLDENQKNTTAAGCRYVHQDFFNSFKLKLLLMMMK